MPPKAKIESTELQVFNLEKFSIAQLPELQGKKEEINAVIELNPIVEIIDTATYESAKKSRTAVKTLRTGLEKEQADVKRKIKTHILDVVDKEYDLLVLDVKKEETDRQNPIAIYEAELEAKRQEKARIEKERVDNIKKEIDDYVTSWKDMFNIMTFNSIEIVSADFLESYTSYDLTILEEFEALFPAKIEELTQYLAGKTSSLTEAENARLEKLRIEAEAKELAIQKAELAAKQKIADEAEAKAKKEREDFEAEKLAFQLEVAKKAELERLELQAKEAELEAKKLAEAKATKKVEVAEILVPELPTVNVCTSLENERNIVNTIPSNLKLYPLTPDECIPPTTTWEAIEKDFKSSAEKSYSKWLKDNFNPPTRL
jgi:hypothetical protein